MKTNEELQKDVQDAIKWEPLLNAAEIGVTVNDGIVTLRGNVDSFAKKINVELAVKNVAGVKAVVEKIRVHLGLRWKKSDSEIATDVLNVLNFNWGSITNDLSVKVERGWINISGELAWYNEKEAITKAVNGIFGVKGVTNNMTIKPIILDVTEKKDVENALMRNWALKDIKIQVQVLDNRVTLIGIVHSLFQKEEAGRLAWNAPGVLSVSNELNIEYCC